MGAVGASLLGGSVAAAQPSPPPARKAATTAPAARTTSPAPPEPVAATAAEGTYGLPQWLPLRRDKPGTEVTVGCTFDSHGSQHGYECGGHHSRWALDFLADTGTPVFAAGPGFARDFTGQPGGSGFGNVVRIDHGFGITTLYGHLSKSFIPPEGTWVDETTQIGLVGQTGSASAPHLHYEVFSGADLGNQESIDPGPLFACRGDLLVSFPQIAGISSWKNLPWGSLTVASDGHDCVADERATPAEPAAAVPSSADADTERSSRSLADLIGSALDLLGLSTDELAKPS